MKNETQITGEGWGDCHIWRYVKSTPNDNRILRYSTWKCRRCFAVFNHMYNYIPDISTAMKACNVPDVCSRPNSNRLLKHYIAGE